MRAVKNSFVRPGLLPRVQASFHKGPLSSLRLSSTKYQHRQLESPIHAVSRFVRAPLGFHGALEEEGCMGLMVNGYASRFVWSLGFRSYSELLKLLACSARQCCGLDNASLHFGRVFCRTEYYRRHYSCQVGSAMSAERLAFFS